MTPTKRFLPPERVRDARHGVVYRNDREFCGWPFICGFWTPANGDLLVAFQKKPSAYRDPGDVNHDEVAKVGPKIVLARSRDRGASWDTGDAGSKLVPLFDLASDPAVLFAQGPRDYGHEPHLDFTDANVLVASGATPDYFRPGSRAWIRVSTDGGHSWRPPIEAPKLGWPSLSGHASAIVRADGTSLVFMTAVSDDGWKRRPVVYASVDGGAGWTFLSAMTPEADDGAAIADRSVGLRYSAHRYFYPRGIALPDGSLLASIRCQRDPTSILWTEIFASDDGGRTWGFRSRVNDWGAPGRPRAHGRRPHRLCLRLPPAAVRRARARERGRGPDLGTRVDPARRRRELGPGLPARDRDRAGPVAHGLLHELSRRPDPVEWRSPTHRAVHLHAGVTVASARGAHHRRFVIHAHRHDAWAG